MIKKRCKCVNQNNGLNIWGIMEKSILVSIPILFIVGTLLHYVYDFFGENKIIGFFVPINESVWEHTKLSYFPIVLWWIITYIVMKDEWNLEGNKWFLAMIVSAVTSIFIIILFYYGYVGSTGEYSFIVNISLFLVSVILGQLLGMHIYRYGNGIPAIISIVIAFLITLLYVWLTIKPRDLPLWKA